MEAKREGKKFQKSYFDVLGLCCTSEVPLIEKILTSLDGIKDFTVIVPTKTLIVVHDSLLVSQLQIVKALNQARLEANIRVYGDPNYKHKWPSPYTVACGVLLLLSFLKYVYSPIRWLAVVAIVVGIPPIILKAVAAVRNFKLDINILVLITVAGSIALRDYWEAGTIVFLFTISEWLESRASHKATAVMSSLVSVVPQKAIIAETGEEINADEVKFNTILAVKAGEVIPIDGVVVEGNCEVDEKNLTGESFPVTKKKDSIVWASTINLNGYISVKTTTMAEDCVVARMANIVEEAQNKKSGTQRFLDKCAKYYTPAIVVISALLAIVPLALHVHNKKQWYHLALVVLVNGCPCALLLSTPVAMFCALSKAATLGVLFKGAQHLETLAGIKIMAFDKTGTITRGEFMVVDYKSLKDEINLSTLLYWISSIECKSSHPMAAALVDYARTHAIEPKPDIVENFQNFPGEGISGKIDDHELYIGNSKIASRAGCNAVPKLEGYDTEGMSVGYVFLGSSPAGIFCLTDVCRMGAKEAIQELKSIGIKIVMLTGDCHGAAKRAQEQLGGALEVIRAELLPEDKASVIKELQKEGPTAMIGDGLNDAPALATADIGISMGVSGSALATESGDIVLMSNDIQRIVKAFRIAKQVRRKIIENVILSFTTKAAIIGLAIAGHPLVWAAVLADVGTCLVVILNSMLLLKGTPKRGTKCCQDKKSKCEAQSCSSSSCGNNKCSESQDQSHGAHSESKVKDHPCCGKVEKNLESQKRGCSDSSSGSCGTKKCSSPTKNQDRNAHHHSHTVKDHRCCGKVEKNLESQKHGCSVSRSGSCGSKNCSSPTKDQAHNTHHHSHTVKDDRCCGEVEKDLESQKHGCSVSRSGSCGCKNCSSPTKDQAHNAHHHSHSVKDDRCCGEVEKDLESHKHGCSESSSGSCGNKKCSSPTKEHAHSTHHHSYKENQSCGPKRPHSHGGSENEECNEKNAREKSLHKHVCCTTKDLAHETKSNKHHSHSTSCTGDNENHLETRLSHPEKKCCGQSQSRDDDDFECVDDNTECNAVYTATKRKQRGCCESYRRECCVRNGHFGTNLDGCLSEIVID